MFIRSERLFLRPAWPEDLAELTGRIDDWAVVRQLEFPAQSAPVPVVQAQVRRFPQFVMTLPGRDGSRLIGCVGLLCGAHGAELAYWLAPEYWRLGYATEAGRAVLSLARTLGHRWITAIHFADNAASSRVLSKLGFNATGETYRRLCPARGVLAKSLVHRRDLGEMTDCGGIGSNRARYAA